MQLRELRCLEHIHKVNDKRILEKIFKSIDKKDETQAKKTVLKN